MLSLFEAYISSEDLGRMYYVPKHPYLMIGVDFATALGGGLAGYHYAAKHGIDPYTGFSFGLVNGSNAGQLGAELIDRSLRNSAGDSYKGSRTVDDAARDFLIGTAAGNAATGAMRAHDLPLAGVAGYGASELAKTMYYGATEPESPKKGKKK